MNIIKEITATESFKNMDQNVKKCQNVESFEECVTRKYIEVLVDKCNCLPIDLRLNEKVKV